jgi:potassium-dependent mechanosensitive channel
MTVRLLLLRLLVCCSLLWPALAAAQDPQIPLRTSYDDPNAWNRLAERAENLVMRETSSQFAITRLRAELVGWRDHFLSQTNVNANRLATVNAQIAALGPLPETGEEAESIAARRAALQAQRQTLLAPRALAQESFARANGLIGEIDQKIIQQQTAALFQRGPTPLNPALMAGAVNTTWQIVRLIGAETWGGLQVQIGNGQLVRNLPQALLLFGLAILLVGFARQWLVYLRQRLSGGASTLLPVWLFLVSLLQIFVSLFGLMALTLGLVVLSIFGLRGEAVIGTIPNAGMTVVLGWWLGRQVFTDGTLPTYLGYAQETRSRARWYTLALAWVMAFSAILDAAVDTMELAAGVAGAIHWPVLAVQGLLLWRLGQQIQTDAEPVPDETVSPGRIRTLIGRFCTLVAVLGPLMAALGYGAAGRAVLTSSILTLALIGGILVLQRIVHDVSTQKKLATDTKGLAALYPVMISFLLYVASLPVFALIWGARTDDIYEIWGRFREGFALGETRISPTDFLMFAVVFVLGYMLTRFIQGTLRRTVLPRTTLDLGGQNAVVAGFGYVGIFLASLIAITTAGIDLSNLAIVAGALSVGIGFGLQNIVSNFVSGIILLIERPISEGDWIEVGGQMGYVRSISVRSTRIETFDRTDVIVPNADLVSGQVTNWTRGNLVGRVIVPVGVAYGTDTQKVEQILREIAEAHPMVIITPPPAVLFMGFGASSLDFEIRAILRDVNFVVRTKSEINHEIARKFAEAGVEIPFPQSDIWLRNPETLKGSPA